MTRKNRSLNEDLLGDLSTQARKLAGSPIIKSLTSLLYGDEDETPEVSAPGVPITPRQSSLSLNYSAPQQDDEAETFEQLPSAPPVNSDLGAPDIFADIQHYIENLFVEKIPLANALKANPRKKALIVGSSQAGVIGEVLMPRLQEKGFVDFLFMPEPAKSMMQILSMTASRVTDKSAYDVFIIFPGFGVSRSEDPETVIRFTRVFEAARCFIVIPPPVTKILDTTTATQNKLNKGRPVAPDYWFKVADSKYAHERESYCSDLKSLVETAGATAIDLRDIFRDAGEVQDVTGVIYPSMKDGIHPGPDQIAKIANAIVEAIFDCQLGVVASDVVKKLKPDDLERHPGIVGDMEEYPATARVLKAVKGDRRFGWRNHPLLNVPKFHQGIDIPVGVGTPVKAVLDGKVVTATSHNIAGNYVEIKHPSKGGVMTRYLHLDSFNVNPGEEVKQGQVIGLSGATGRITGPHLHFEVWPDRYGMGKPNDPEAWLAQNTDTIYPVD